MPRLPSRRSESGGQLAIVFTITRGRLYRVAAIDVAGVAAGPSAGLSQLIRSKSGDPYVQARVDRDVAAIIEDYRRRGYTSVRVASRVTPAAPATPSGDVPAAVTVTSGGRTPHRGPGHHVRRRQPVGRGATARPAPDERRRPVLRSSASMPTVRSWLRRTVIVAIDE